MRIELDIDELVLDGPDPRDGLRVREAVERDLARLVSAESGRPRALPQSREIDHLDGGIAEGASGDAVGTRVARALYGALRR